MNKLFLRIFALTLFMIICVQGMCADDPVLKMLNGSAADYAPQNAIAAEGGATDSEADPSMPKALQELLNRKSAEDPEPVPFGSQAYEHNPFAVPSADETAVMDGSDAQMPAAAAANDETVPFASDLTFAHLGAKEGVSLRAGQYETGLNFNLPLDKVITSARLNLSMEVTQQMARRGSHLELTLNGQPVATLPLNRADGPAEYEISLPFEYFGTSNTFTFRIKDDEEFSCMVDYTRRYSVSMLPTSVLHLEGHRLQVGSDLSIFPLPFFDVYDVSKNAVNIVLPKNPRRDEINGAAVLASWFGMRSDYRGIKFNVRTGEIPEDNAIIFARPKEHVGSVVMPDHESISVVDHPMTKAYKLILIAAEEKGRFTDAVFALTSGKISSNTKSMTFEASKVAGRVPYDAPKWIPTDRKVYLSELLSQDQSLVSPGVWHTPLNISFRAAPDLYQLYGEPSELSLSYNFPLEQWIDEDHSWLNVVLSGNFLSDLSVNKKGLAERLWRYAGGDARQEKSSIPVQPYMIYGDNNLSLYFDIKLKPGAPCSLLRDNNIKSAVLDDSYIDLSNTSHFARMPNLSFFVGAAYPFSKYADFSHTLLLLPKNPSSAEIQTLLDLSARSGKATGVPIWYADTVLGMGSLGNRGENPETEILAVSTLKQSDFMEKMLAKSAFIYSTSGHDLSVREYGPLSMQGGVIKSLSRLLSGDFRPENIEATRYLRSNMSWRGFVSTVSPWNQKAIMVVATASDDDQLKRLTDDLDNDLINREIRGDLAIISGDESVRSFRVGDFIFTGEVSSYFALLHFLGQHEIWLSVIVFIFISLFGIVLSSYLKRRARRRLAASGEEK